MLSARVITPGSLPVSLAEVKRHLGLSSDEHDLDVELLIKSAANELVRRAGIALTTTRIEVALQCFPPSGLIELPYPPLSSIVSVVYRDTDDVEQTLTSVDYQLDQPDGVPAKLYPATDTEWPTVKDDRFDAVKITFDAGVASADNVSPEARLFIKHRCRAWFDNPDGDAFETRAIDSLVRSLWVGNYAGIQAY